MQSSCLILGQTTCSLIFKCPSTGQVYQVYFCIRNSPPSCLAMPKIDQPDKKKWTTGVRIFRNFHGFFMISCLILQEFLQKLFLTLKCFPFQAFSQISCKFGSNHSHAFRVGFTHRCTFDRPFGNTGFILGQTTCS